MLRWFESRRRARFVMREVDSGDAAAAVDYQHPSGTTTRGHVRSGAVPFTAAGNRPFTVALASSFSRTQDVVSGVDSPDLSAGRHHTRGGETAVSTAVPDPAEELAVRRGIENTVTTAWISHLTRGSPAVSMGGSVGDADTNTLASAVDPDPSESGPGNQSGNNSSSDDFIIGDSTTGLEERASALAREIGLLLRLMNEEREATASASSSADASSSFGISGVTGGSANLLRRLPTFAVERGAILAGTATCPICLDEFFGEVMMLPCLCVGHLDCLSRAILHDVRCPTHRLDVREQVRGHGDLDGFSTGDSFATSTSPPAPLRSAGGTGRSSSSNASRRSSTVPGSRGTSDADVDLETWSDGGGDPVPRSVPTTSADGLTSSNDGFSSSSSSSNSGNSGRSRGRPARVLNESGRERSPQSSSSALDALLASNSRLLEFLRAANGS